MCLTAAQEVGIRDFLLRSDDDGEEVVRTSVLGESNVNGDGIVIIFDGTRILL